ncbi:TolC family protein [Oryzomicrobium sp.]|uniref:TolC family protein n=1 Tax=Oryzomicrobium sp. TaxID=1911578 RepID=UPI002FE2C747
MKTTVRPLALAVLVSFWWTAAQAETQPPGASVDSLLAIAKEQNPEYAGFRYEAEAATERVVPAGALPDPKLRTELRDITRMGEQNATLAPTRVGSTRYLLMQDVPWFGKRDLKREIAELEAQGAQGRALGSWTEISTKVKTLYAQLYYLSRNERLTREILDLMVRLEKVAQVRYAGGLAAQQDVVRAQVEQTGMRNELVALASERRQLQARLNALLGRPAIAPLAEPEVLRKLPAPAKLEYAALEDRVRGRNPLLYAANSQVQAAEKTRELTYKNRYPDFTLGVSPIQYQNAVKEWEVMVELNIPLQQSSRRAQEREAEAMLTAAKLKRDATANQVLADLVENLSGIDAARQTETLVNDSLLPQAQLTYQAALAGYETGKVDFATLLDAQRQIRVAKQNQIKAQADGQVRLAEIERLLGEGL